MVLKETLDIEEWTEGRVKEDELAERGLVWGDKLGKITCMLALNVFLGSTLTSTSIQQGWD